MKLSIWQQFSSNHSGMFFIVGSFETPEKAEAAYDELRQILMFIDRWHQEHPEESTRSQEDPQRGPLPPEAEIVARYGVAWPFPIDWTNWAQYHYLNSPRPDFRAIGEHASESAAQLIDKAVSLVGNLVYVSNPDQTWMGIEPFASIIRKIGAAPVFAVDMHTDDGNETWPNAWKMRITCTAASETEAENLVNLIRPHLADKPAMEDREAPPWNEYEANLNRIMQEASVLKGRPISILLAKDQQLSSYVVEPYRTQERRKRVMVSGGSVVRNGTTLEIDLPIQLGLTMAAIIVFLEIHHCSHVQCVLIAPEKS